MWYVYVLESLKRKGQWYIGCSKDLRNRFEKHNNGQVKSTKNFTPFKLIYYEACLNNQDAYKREKYLKSGYGRRWLKKRLNIYLESGITTTSARKVAGSY